MFGKTLKSVCFCSLVNRETPNVERGKKFSCNKSLSSRSILAVDVQDKNVCKRRRWSCFPRLRWLSAGDGQATGCYLSIIENNICVCFCRTSGGKLMCGLPSSATVGATGGRIFVQDRDAIDSTTFFFIFLFVRKVFMFFNQIQNSANTSASVGILVPLYLAQSDTRVFGRTCAFLPF